MFVEWDFTTSGLWGINVDDMGVQVWAGIVTVEVNRRSPRHGVTSYHPSHDGGRGVPQD